MDKAINELAAKNAVLSVLFRHVGAHRAIGMDRLCEAVFGRTVQHKINDTRKVRRLITRLREEGLPIASVSSTEGGGYYIAAAGSELEDYLERLHRRALRALALEAGIRRTSLRELLGQMQLRLEGGDAAER